LKALKPETIIVMNPIYKDEIARAARELGVAGDVITV
jgi:hypothetical protein